MYFLTFFNIFTADTNTFFKSLLPPLVGFGEVVFLQSCDYPLPRALEAVLGDRDADQLVLDLGE
jgi:hypothetical protein